MSEKLVERLRNISGKARLPRTFDEVYRDVILCLSDCARLGDYYYIYAEGFSECDWNAPIEMRKLVFEKLATEGLKVEDLGTGQTLISWESDKT